MIKGHTIRRLSIGETQTWANSCALQLGDALAVQVASQKHNTGSRVVRILETARPKFKARPFTLLLGDLVVRVFTFTFLIPII